MQITRKLYKEVKKYDHTQLNNFLTDIYTEGVIKGREKALEELTEERMKDIERMKAIPTPEELKEQLMSIRGIGEGKADAVIKALEAIGYVDKTG